MRELSTAILLGTVFSGESVPSPEALRRAGADLRTVVAGIGARTVLPPALAGVALPGSRRYFLARDRLRRFAADIVAARRGGTGGDDGDLLSALLAAREPDSGQGLSDTELVDQVVTMFVGGIDTTAATMAWMLHAVAEHPAVARRLKAEVDTVLAGRAPSVEDLSDLPLTGRVVTETLRRHPVVWIVTRTVTADTVLGGHRLPAGTVVAFSPYLVHHRADHYPDADVFDPDRWSPERTPPARGGLSRLRRPSPQLRGKRARPGRGGDDPGGGRLPVEPAPRRRRPGPSHPGRRHEPARPPAAGRRPHRHRHRHRH